MMGLVPLKENTPERWSLSLPLEDTVRSLQARKRVIYETQNLPAP